MAHVDLGTTSVLCSSIGRRRTVGMTSSGSDTLVQLFAADTASAAFSAGVPLLDQNGRPVILRAGQMVQIDDASTYVGYKVLNSTTAPSAVWMDGDAPGPATPGTTSALGTVQLSVTPATAATPIAVGTNDPRVCQFEKMIGLSSSDGSFAESTVWIPGVIGTIAGVTLSAPAAITQSDTDYLTFTLGIRDGAGGGASSVASKTTKTTGGGAFLAFQALSLGSISNATTAAASQVTFKSVKSGAGQAVAGYALLRITYTVP